MTDTNLGTAAGEIFAKAFTLGYETGRKYIPAGGMALTAEQVEDVKIVLGQLERGGPAFEAAHERLRALFPATEPAEDVKPCGSNSITLGWCKLAARHEGLHTNGTYLWGTASEPDPPALAEPAEEETKAEAESDLDMHPDAVYGREYVEQAKVRRIARAVKECDTPASSPVVPAPTETGLWQTWQEVPDDTPFWSRDKRETNSWWWIKRTTEQRKELRQADACGETVHLGPTSFMNEFAPFVAAAEEG